MYSKENREGRVGHNWGEIFIGLFHVLEHIREKITQRNTNGTAVDKI